MKSYLTGIATLAGHSSGASAASRRSRREQLDRREHFLSAQVTRVVMRTLCFAFALGLAAGVALAEQSSGERSVSQAGSGKLARGVHRHHGRRAGKLKPGDPAPDFDLKQLHSEERVRLSDFTNKKPVALVFGSYT